MQEHTKASQGATEASQCHSGGPNNNSDDSTGSVSASKQAISSTVIATSVPVTANHEDLERGPVPAPSASHSDAAMEPGTQPGPTAASALMTLSTISYSKSPSRRTSATVSPTTPTLAPPMEVDAAECHALDSSTPSAAKQPPASAPASSPVSHLASSPMAPPRGTPQVPTNENTSPTTDLATSFAASVATRSRGSSVESQPMHVVQNLQHPLSYDHGSNRLSGNPGHSNHHRRNGSAPSVGVQAHIAAGIPRASSATASVTSNAPGSVEVRAESIVTDEMMSENHTSPNMKHHETSNLSGSLPSSTSRTPHNTPISKTSVQTRIVPIKEETMQESTTPPHELAPSTTSLPTPPASSHLNASGSLNSNNISSNIKSSISKISSSSERRGSGFLLLAAQMAEQAEAAQKAQRVGHRELAVHTPRSNSMDNIDDVRIRDRSKSREDAIRQAAMQFQMDQVMVTSSAPIDDVSSASHARHHPRPMAEPATPTTTHIHQLLSQQADQLNRFDRQADQILSQGAPPESQLPFQPQLHPNSNVSSFHPSSNQVMSHAPEFTPQHAVPSIPQASFDSHASQIVASLKTEQVPYPNGQQQVEQAPTSGPATTSTFSVPEVDQEFRDKVYLAAARLHQQQQLKTEPQHVVSHPQQLHPQQLHPQQLQPQQLQPQQLRPQQSPHQPHVQQDQKQQPQQQEQPPQSQLKSKTKSKPNRRKSNQSIESLPPLPPAPLVPPPSSQEIPLAASSRVPRRRSSTGTKGSTTPSNKNNNLLPSGRPRSKPQPHVYHDYSSIPDTQAFVRKKTGGVTQPFPEKLMEMLDAETIRNPDIVSWLPHGRAFIVRKPKLFTADIMHGYFKQSKLTSFQRQLNLYGFRRITQGPDAGAYYHELFLRGRPQLCMRMNRQKVKGTGHKQPTDVTSEPNFYLMPSQPPLPGTSGVVPNFGDVGNSNTEHRASSIISEQSLPPLPSAGDSQNKSEPQYPNPNEGTIDSKLPPADPTSATDPSRPGVIFSATSASHPSQMQQSITGDSNYNAPQTPLGQHPMSSASAYSVFTPSSAGVSPGMQAASLLKRMASSTNAPGDFSLGDSAVQNSALSNASTTLGVGMSQEHQQQLQQDGASEGSSQIMGNNHIYTDNNNYYTTVEGRGATAPSSVHGFQPPLPGPPPIFGFDSYQASAPSTAMGQMSASSVTAFSSPSAAALASSSVPQYASLPGATASEMTSVTTAEMPQQTSSFLPGSNSANISAPTFHVQANETAQPMDTGAQAAASYELQPGEGYAVAENAEMNDSNGNDHATYFERV